MPFVDKDGRSKYYTPFEDPYYGRPPKKGAVKQPKTVDEALQTSYTRKRDIRTQKHILELEQLLIHDQEFQDTYLQDIQQLKSLIEDKNSIKNMLESMISTIPEKEKQIRQLQEQIDAIYLFNHDQNKNLIDELQELKKISIVMRDKLKGLGVAYEEQSKERSRLGKPSKSVQKYKEIENATEAILSQRLFKKGKEYSQQQLEKQNKRVEQQQKRKTSKIDNNDSQKEIEIIVQQETTSKAFTITQKQIIYNQQREKQEVFEYVRSIDPYQDRPDLQRYQRYYKAKQAKKLRQERQEYVLSEMQAMAVAFQGFISSEKERELKGYIEGQTGEDQGDQVVDEVNKLYKEYQQKTITLDTANALVQQTQKLVHSLLNISQNMMSVADSMSGVFANMFSPTDQLVGLIGMQVQGINTFTNLFPIALDLFSMPFSMIGGVDEESKKSKGKKEDAEKKSSSMLSIFTMVAKIAETAFTFLQSSFTIAISAIMGGINMLVSVLQSIWGLLKKIFQTSKLMDSLLSILNLILTMFFLPFFSVFGDRLLSHIFDILNWALEFSTSKVWDYLDGITQAQRTIIGYFEENKEMIADLAIRFIKELLPLMIKVFTLIMPFVLYFTSIFIANQDKVQQLLKNGIEFGKTLIQNNIITLFILFGKQTMEFIQENKEQIIGTMETMQNILQWALGAFSFVINHMNLICVQAGQALGAYLNLCILISFGGMGKITEALQASGFKWLQGKLTTKTFILGGQGLGQVIGELLYLTFFSFKEGGYIPQTPGGVFVRVAEKETEYIIPEPKMHLIRGHNNLIIDINGDAMIVDDCMKEIVQAIDQQQDSQRFR